MSPRRRQVRDSRPKISTHDDSTQTSTVSQSTAAIKSAGEKPNTPLPGNVRRAKKRHFGCVFMLGVLVALVIGFFVAKQQDVIRMDTWPDLNIDSLMDVIPQGILKDAKELSVRPPILPPFSPKPVDCAY